ncbi:hypothetical protein G6F35_011196 [Rhizopus arrhizus]|nr:hypothetical protein G6F35_011196 [Rhizopus arrhizus]
MESVGDWSKEEEDMESCPARTRPNWPKEITPWWVPSCPYEKPPYSYATLIAQAILCSKDGQLTLNDIYIWISNNYPAYRLGERGWKNSVRHNLSLNKKWFQKRDRRPTEANPGKGSYWTLVPGAEQVFIDSLTQATKKTSDAKQQNETVTPAWSFRINHPISAEEEGSFATFRVGNTKNKRDKTRHKEKDRKGRGEDSSESDYDSGIDVSEASRSQDRVETHPLSAQYSGAWMTMDNSDFDQDMYPDYFYTKLYPSHWQHASSISWSSSSPINQINSPSTQVLQPSYHPFFTLNNDNSVSFDPFDYASLYEFVSMQQVLYS